MSKLELRIIKDNGSVINFEYDGTLTSAVLIEVSSLIAHVRCEVNNKLYSIKINSFKDAENEFIKGIKAIREITKIGLREAKDAADQIKNDDTTFKLPGSFSHEIAQEHARMLGEFFHYVSVTAV